MSYIEGFVAAVPAANKDAYARHAAEMAPLFKDFGATRVMDAWSDDVPEGKVTDFKRAVKAKEDEVVVIGWMEYPSRQARDSANEKMMSDPRMKEMGAAMPFDGQRMIFGGFEPLLDEAQGDRGGYLVAVPEGNKQAYREMAQKTAQVFKECGSTRVVEGWGDDVPEGKVTDYKGAVKAEAGEKVVYSWVEWPDKATRDAGWKKAMEDPRMQFGKDMPFDGQRMIYGGFTPILDQ